ncbi:hypothetical protein ACWD5V_28880 [Streptomyces sp. NPDC002523]
MAGDWPRLLDDSDLASVEGDQDGRGEDDALGEGLFGGADSDEEQAAGEYGDDQGTDDDAGDPVQAAREGCAAR